MMWQKWEQKGGVASPTGVLWVAVLQRRAGRAYGSSPGCPTTFSVSPSGREGRAPGLSPDAGNCWEIRLGKAFGGRMAR